MFGTSRRHEICLSGDGWVTGVYSDASGSGTGNGVSSAGKASGLDTRASCAAHRCATLRATIKKMTDRSLINVTLFKS